jgi:xylulokinase
MAQQYLIAHDLGTSGVKAALTDLTGRVIASAESRYPVYYTSDGGAEQDVEEWWQGIVKTTREMMAKAGVEPSQIAGMSMDAQMSGTVPVDMNGKPLRRVMIWLDSRAQKEGEILSQATGVPFFTGKAGSAKIMWIKNNEPEIYARTHKFLDCKDVLQFRMTGEFGTDLSCAIATLCLNPATMGWWEDILGIIEVPVEKFPPLMPSTQVLGKLTPEAAAELGLLPGTPVVSGGGDVPCALIGSGAISAGRAHLYLGTSAWIFASSPDFTMEAPGVAPGISCEPGMFYLGGEMDNAGGCLKWFIENMMGKEDKDAAVAQGLSSFQYMDLKAAETPPGAEGLLFLPWMWGERSPVDDDLVRGGFAMLATNHSKWHMARAVLEGCGHQLRWIADALASAGTPLTEVNVIGGGAFSKIWLQMLADVTNLKLLQVEGPLDACARGAAMTAAVGLGFYKDFAEVEKAIRLTGVEFVPNPANRELYDKAHANFLSLYQPFSDIGHDKIAKPQPELA